MVSYLSIAGDVMSLFVTGCVSPLNAVRLNRVWFLYAAVDLKWVYTCQAYLYIFLCHINTIFWHVRIFLVQSPYRCHLRSALHTWISRKSSKQPLYRCARRLLAYISHASITFYAMNRIILIYRSAAVFDVNYRSKRI